MGDYLAALGDDEDSEDLPQLAGDVGAKTSFGRQRAGITGIEAVDRAIYEAQDGLADLKTALNISTTAAVFTTLGVGWLIIRDMRRGR